MIPRFDLVPNSEFPSHARFPLSAHHDFEEDGLPGGFHESEFIETDLSEAEAILDAEERGLKFVDERSTTAFEFDSIAADIEYEAAEFPGEDAPELVDGAWYGLNGLELGVAGLVYALNAMGVVTVASCRSHSQAHRAWSDYPIVVLAPNRGQVEQLRPLVILAEGGFEVDEVNRPELVAIVAPSVVEMMTLGRLVLAQFIR